MRTKILRVKDGERVGISRFPSEHKAKGARYIKEKVFGHDALTVLCGVRYYDVTSEPSIYHLAHL